LTDNCWGHIARIWSVFSPRDEFTAQLLHYIHLKSFKFLMWLSLVFSNGIQDMNCLSETRKWPFNS
jgi:hypothetical protein